MSEQPEVPQKRESFHQRQIRWRHWMGSFFRDEAALVYRRTTHGKDRARVLTVELFLFIRELVREFYDVEGSSRAASLAFTTLLSLVPLVVALSQVLRSYFAKLFPDFQSQIDMILNVVLPYHSAQISYSLNRFAENAAAASTFGAIIFLIVSFRLFMVVEMTVNRIWKVESARGYRQKIRAFTMLLFWGPILIGLSFTTTASLEGSPYLHVFVDNNFVISLVPAVVLFIAFTMLFWLVPSTHVQLRSAALGAIVTTALFQLVRFLFGIYAQHLFQGRLNVIYGTLGLAIIFLLALEVMWVVILLGVEISYVFQNLQGILRASEEQLTENPRYDVYFAIRALVEITRRFERREEAPSSYRLAKEFRSTDKQMMSVLKKLELAQLVKEVGGDWPGYLPGCDPDRISVEEVVVCMEGGARDLPFPETMTPEKEAVSEVFAALRQCAAAALEQRTIGQMVRRLYGERQPSRIADATVPSV